ncbi:MAG: hypothetical protein IT260_03935 [Saprospiraceae bacterium]|nr:hypothetical protein [Saprospiraceae bacterium]
MTDTTGNIFFGNGTTHSSRINPAFEPGFAPIDNRSTADLINLGAAYAKLVSFYQLDNAPSGTWERFFQNDISALLAAIISVDTERIEQDYNHLVDKILHVQDVEAKKESFLQLLDSVAHMARTFDAWYQQSTRMLTPGRGLEHDVSGELFNVITKKLAYPLSKFRTYLKDSEKALGKSIATPLDDLSPCWEQFLSPNGTAGPLFGKEKDLAFEINQATIMLRPMYRVFQDTLTGVSYQFRRYFDRSLNNKNSHPPHLGLFIAFLKLFGYAQQSLNDYSARFLDLYYAKVLQQNRLPNQADKVHVCFEIADQVPSFTLPAGTQLIAGYFDDGSEILYATEEDLEINQTRIDSIKTIFLSKGVRETLSTFELVSNIYAAEVANSKDGRGTPQDAPNQSWPTFGEEQFDKLGELQNMAQASVGFAISSPVLSLREGVRLVELNLHFEPESTRVYEKLVEDVLQKDDLIHTREEAFYKIFNTTGGIRNISIFVSGPRGWFQVDPSEIKFNLPENNWTPETLSIFFKLHVYDPALTAFDPNVFPNDFFATTNPVIKIVANREREPYVYSFLKHIKLTEVDIQVSVENLKKCQLYNNIGQLDTTQPFQVFGPTPAVGSYLLIGVSEIFRKKIKSLRLELDWHDLPKTYDAFQEYFKAYALRPEDYSVKVSALSAGSFSPTESHQLLEFKLFETSPNRNLLSAIDLSAEALGMLRMEITPELPNLNAYDSDARTGYFKIELASPDDGFGHPSYQRVITRSMAQNSKAISESANSDTAVDTQALNIPNPPLAPTVKALRINYEASARIRLHDNSPDYPQEIFHLHPFGQEKIYPQRTSSGKFPLFPLYDEDGYLFLGLRGAKPRQELSLFFQLLAVNHHGLTVDTVPEIKWAYLGRNNEWRWFNDRDVLSDSTDKFTKSGIIRLRIPEDISNRSTILPSGLFWIRASVRGKVEALCHTIDVRTQAVRAHWMDNGNPDFLRNPLPPHAISGLWERYTEIQSVVQPFESFDGKAEENDQEYFTRVSERLRHKNRALTHWDYERLTLSQFPGIAQVKCISFLSHPIFDKPPKEEDTLAKLGEPEKIHEVKVSGIRRGDGIVLVVIPKHSRYLEVQTPVVNYKLLNDIEEYLLSCSPPFAKVQVRNPEYEFIRVYCKVKFTDRGNEGRRINDLKADLRHFICPWMRNDQTNVEIGGSLSVEAVKNFMNGLPYVKFVTKLSMLHIIPMDEQNQAFNIEDTAQKNHNKVIFASNPWAVLIADNDHDFSVIDGEEIEEMPAPVTAPVSFKTAYDILKGYRAIRVIERKYEKIKIKEPKGEQAEYTLKIKL